MKLETRIYGWLLRVYPKDFRLEFGQEMAQVFRLDLEKAKLEKRTLMFWISTVFDCLYGATREWLFRRGESMHWLRGMAIFFGLLAALQGILFPIVAVYVVQNLILFTIPALFPTSSIPFFNINEIGFLIIQIAVFLSLPSSKNRLEWFGFITFNFMFILGVFLPYIFGSFADNFANPNSIIYKIILFIEAISLLSMIFARVKYKNKKFDFREMPRISKILILYFLSIFFMIPIRFWIYENLDFYSSFFNIGNSEVYFPSIISFGNLKVYLPNIAVTGDLIGIFFSNMILVFGIWISKPAQTTEIHKLVSS